MEIEKRKRGRPKGSKNKSSIIDNIKPEESIIIINEDDIIYYRAAINYALPDEKDIQSFSNFLKIEGIEIEK